MDKQNIGIIAPVDRLSTHTICRICLIENCPDCVEASVNSEWAELFYFCIGKTVGGNENEPPRVFCGRCASSLKKFAEFKELCLKYDYFWDNIQLQTGSSEVNIQGGTQVKVKIEYEEKFQVDNEDHFEHSELPIFFDIEQIKPEDSDKEEMIESKVKNEDLNLNKHKTQNDADENRNKNKVTKKKVKKKVSAQNELHYCGICDFKSENKQLVHDHFNKHCDDNQLKCGLCDYVGVDVAHMVSHRVKHFPDSNILVTCPKCPRIRIQMYRLEFHYRSFHLKKIGGMCSVCNKTIRHRAVYERHMLLHDGTLTQEYVCDICGRKFSSRNYILRHIQEFHLKKRPPKKHLCQYCGQGFIKKYDLQSHVFNIHTESKPVHCDHCNRTFKNRVTYENHQRILNMEKKLKCDFCPKLFPTQSRLRIHMYWHDKNNRPFACNYCEKTYKAANSLKVHLLTHTGDSPYVCDICNKRLSSLTSLKRHKESHSGVQRHICQYCPSRYTDKRRLADHCKRKHKDVPNPDNL